MLAPHRERSAAPRAGGSGGHGDPGCVAAAFRDLIRHQGSAYSTKNSSQLGEGSHRVSFGLGELQPR